MKQVQKTTRMKVYHSESEIVMLPELVGMNWVFLNNRTVSRLKIQRGGY